MSEQPAADGNERARVLVLDDDPGVLFALKEALEDAGFEVRAAATPSEAEKSLGAVDAILSDHRLGAELGLDWLKRVWQHSPHLPGVLLTAQGSERLAVEAMRAGAFGYLAKPYDVDELSETMARACELGRLRRLTEERLQDHGMGAGFVAQSAAMQACIRTAARLATRDVRVLVVGETGTGKERIATYLHRRSPRAQGPCVRFNCAAVPDQLAEAELFGFEKGAFTGANRRQAGFFARAHGGTLILDEVGELSLGVQAKLLRVLQEGEVQPLGAGGARKVDVKVVAVTHRNLRQMVARGKFRQDLFYRLATLELRLPPLRERPEDIRALSEVFRRQFCDAYGLNHYPLPTALLERFQAHPWPGNVRELEHCLGALLAMSEDGDLTGCSWHPEGDGQSAGGLPMGVDGAAHGNAPLPARVAQFEKGLLQGALQQAHGNRTRAAVALGITRTTFLSKLKRHGLR